MRHALLLTARRWQHAQAIAEKTLKKATANASINDIPAVLVPDSQSIADHEELIELDNAIPKPATQTVKIQLPPKRLAVSQLQSLALENESTTADLVNNSIKWDLYEGAPRVRPTKSGYIPPDDPAYTGWSDEEDKKLIHVMTNTPQGKGSDFRFINEAYFPERRERDIRMRWNTFLKPRQYTRDKKARHVLEMRHKYGDDVTIVDGRWCVVPSGRVTPQPGESKLAYGGKRQYDSGPTILDIAVQGLVEAERARRYEMSGDLDEKREQRRRRQTGHLLVENTEWLREEDIVLRAAFEEFGPQWDRISRTLKTRFRNADECRERFTQQMKYILAADGGKEQRREVEESQQ